MELWLLISVLVQDWVLDWRQYVCKRREDSREAIEVGD